MSIQADKLLKVDRGWAGTISQWKAFANPIKKGQQFESSAFDMVESIVRSLNQRNGFRYFVADLMRRNDWVPCRPDSFRTSAFVGISVLSQMRYVFLFRDPVDGMF